MDELPWVVDCDGADILGVVITTEIDHGAVLPVASDTGAGVEFLAVRAVARGFGLIYDEYCQINSFMEEADYLDNRPSPFAENSCSGSTSRE
jgi:hypothetical protein